MSYEKDEIATLIQNFKPKKAIVINNDGFLKLLYLRTDRTFNLQSMLILNLF